MEKKWNLQDIKPAEKRRPTRMAPARKDEPRMTASEAPRREVNSNTRGKGKRRSLLLIISAFVLLAILVVTFAAITGKTTVTIFPRWREPTVNAIFEADSTSSESGLVYEVLTLEAEAEREVTATGQEEVEAQATGEIVIYKTTPGDERLITNTRFESSDGKVFRITESAVVPGGSEENPGSVRASVFADQSGPDYNLSAGNKFTVPGFEESDLMELFEAVYAENPSSFSGGHKGPKFTIDETELNNATDSLRKELQEALAGRVSEEKPAGFILYNPSITYSYQTLPGEDVGNGQVKIKEKAILRAPMFKNEDFASFIAAATIPGYENEPVRVEDPTALTFEYTGETSLTGDGKISFKLLGRPQIVWTYDEEQLKEDLAGGSQTALNSVLGGYPAIEKANATIRPFWKRSFPDDPADINIEEVIELEE